MQSLPAMTTYPDEQSESQEGHSRESPRTEVL